MPNISTTKSQSLELILILTLILILILSLRHKSEPDPNPDPNPDPTADPNPDRKERAAYLASLSDEEALPLCLTLINHEHKPRSTFKRTSKPN